MTSKRGSVAVVVPLLNEADGLPRLLQKLGACRVEELVLVDGGSCDGTPKMLQESGHRWLSSKPGRAIQMNAGARVCKSDIILFLHADTEISSDSLEFLRDLAINQEIVGGRFDVRLSGGHVALRMIEWFINLRSRLSKISTGDQAIFVRREVFESMGGFADLPLMEDIEFSRRLKRQGSVACLRQKVCTSSRRWERYGIARTVLLMWRLRLLYWLGVSPAKLAVMYRDAR
ncbi:MAG: glycosyl transferase [Zetaproteobacteria bacterium CG1_02_55_237]|nr:MAG: glycosyl transferase [Zetaproteobacteria bacterium CG1_02_55_237]